MSGRISLLLVFFSAILLSCSNQKQHLVTSKDAWFNETLSRLNESTCFGATNSLVIAKYLSSGMDGSIMNPRANQQQWPYHPV